MRKLLAVLLLLVLGFAVGRLTHQKPVNAQVPGGHPPPPCHDVNGDGEANLSDAVYLLNWFFRGGPEPQCANWTELEAQIDELKTQLAQCRSGICQAILATGQSTCYDQEGKEIPCDSDTCPGQDGFYQIGCPIKGRFVDNGNGTVTDTCTGLMWQQDTADTDANGLIDEADKLIWCDALQYCENLSLAGHDDWRLPNVRELHSIIHFGLNQPAIDPVFHTLGGAYWSSTSIRAVSDQSWYVPSPSGAITFFNKSADFLVRAVRGP